MSELRTIGLTWSLAGLLAAGCGLALGRYGWNVVAFLFLYTALATSWSWLRASGLFSLGQAAFFGTGALAEAWFVSTGNLPIVIAWPLAVATGALIALPLVPALRLPPASFALATLAYALLLKGVAGNIPALGPEGFLLPAAPAFEGSAPLVLALLAILAVGPSLGYYAFLRRRSGRAAAAIRQAPETAQACGIGLVASRWLPMLANAAATAGAGALYAHLVGSVEPVVVFAPAFSVLPLILGMAGGALHPLGGLAGTLALYPIDELLLRPALPQAHLLFYGLALVGLLLLRPAGLLRAQVPAVPAGVRHPVSRSVTLTADHVRVRRRGVIVLDDVTLELRPGQVLALLGPNGAGKSSLLLSLAGVLPLARGRIAVNGRAAPRGGARRTRLGVVHTFQAPHPFREWTVCENVAIAAEQAGATADVAGILDALQLTPLGDRRAEQLSVGEGKRLELARALALNPALLLLDEPLAGLSPSAAATTTRLIRSVRDRGIPIVWIEHGFNPSQLADQVLILAEGRIRFHGVPAEWEATRGPVPA